MRPLANKIKLVVGGIDYPVSYTHLRRSINIDIQVDGGIDKRTCEYVKAAGANVLVAGSAILKSDNPEILISHMKQ